MFMKFRLEYDGLSSNILSTLASMFHSSLEQSVGFVYQLFQVNIFVHDFQACIVYRYILSFYQSLKVTLAFAKFIQFSIHDDGFTRVILNPILLLVAPRSLIVLVNLQDCWCQLSEQYYQRILCHSGNLHLRVINFCPSLVHGIYSPVLL